MSDEGRTQGAAGPGLAPGTIGEATLQDPVEPQLEPTPQPTHRSVEELARFIVEEAGPPIDLWAVAALLESFGIRDRDAVELYGRRDVFGLAMAVQTRLPEAEAAVAGPSAPVRAVGRERIVQVARVYGRGTFFFVPLALQLVALLAVGTSQFAAIDFTIRDASIVAVAAALSFIVTAGFTQALGLIAPVYIESGKHMLAEAVTWGIMGIAAIAVLVVGAVAYALGALLGGYTSEDLRIAAAYYALLAALGLAGAMLYMLRRFLWMIIATVVSLAVAGILRAESGLAIEQVHWISLTVAVTIQLGVAAVILHRRAGNTRGDLRLARLPPGRLMLRRTLPFALYGLLYFIFLTADRALGWAAGSNPLPLWFHPEYELGLDWALAGVVFALAFLEVTVEDFSRMMVPLAERHRVDAVREHNRELLRFWARQLAYVAGLAAAGTWLALGTAIGLNELDLLGPAQQVYDDPVTRYVFGLGVLGYALLALGIANSVFVITLGRPWRAVVSIGAGLLVSLTIGTVATSVAEHWTAVFGMVAGAGVFAVVAAWQTWRTLRHADFFTYSAW